MVTSGAGQIGENDHEMVGACLNGPCETAMCWLFGCIATLGHAVQF